MTDPGGFLRHASFRGAPFFSRRDVRPMARALQIDEFPLSNRWSVLNLGRKAVTWRVDAYVADEADAQARIAALEAALEVDAPGLLVLPARRPVMAWARATESDWNADKLGYFGLRLEFVEDGEAAAPALSLGFAERILVDGLAQVAGLAGAAEVALASIAGDARGIGRFESLGFAAEGALRFAGLGEAALALTAADDVVAAAGTVASWASHGELAETLSLIGEMGLGLLEERAAA